MTAPLERVPGSKGAAPAKARSRRKRPQCSRPRPPHSLRPPLDCDRRSLGETNRRPPCGPPPSEAGPAEPSPGRAAFAPGGFADGGAPPLDARVFLAPVGTDALAHLRRNGEPVNSPPQKMRKPNGRPRHRLTWETVDAGSWTSRHHQNTPATDVSMTCAPPTLPAKGASPLRRRAPPSEASRWKSHPTPPAMRCRAGSLSARTVPEPPRQRAPPRHPVTRRPLGRLRRARWPPRRHQLGGRSSPNALEPAHSGSRALARV